MSPSSPTGGADVGNRQLPKSLTNRRRLGALRQLVPDSRNPPTCAGRWRELHAHPGQSAALTTQSSHTLRAKGTLAHESGSSLRTTSGVSCSSPARSASRCRSNASPALVNDPMAELSRGREYANGRTFDGSHDRVGRTPATEQVDGGIITSAFTQIGGPRPTEVVRPRGIVGHRERDAEGL